MTDRGFFAEDVNRSRGRFPGDTPAHVAMREGNVEIVKYLWSRGADFTIKNKLGDQPLQAAAAVTVNGQFFSFFILFYPR